MQNTVFVYTNLDTLVTAKISTTKVLLLLSTLLWIPLFWDWSYLRRDTTYWTALARIFINTKAGCETGSKFTTNRSSHPEVLLGKGVLENAANLQENTHAEVWFQSSCCSFIEITLRHGCSPVNLLHIFRTPFSKSTSGWLLLQ